MSTEPVKPWKVILPVLILAGAGLCFVLLNMFKSEPEKKDEIGKVPLVSAESVHLQSRDLVINSQGLFKSLFETTLTAQVAGEVVHLSPGFERGALVKKGQLLLQIDPFNYEVQVEEARAQLAAARAALVLEEAQVEVAKAEWEKVEESLPTDLSLRKPQLEQARARVNAAEAGLKQATKNLERTRVIAPFDALIAERKVSLGAFVGVANPVGLVMDVSRGEVRLPVSRNQFKYIKNQGLNSKVTLSSDLGAAQWWQARIVRNEGLIDMSSRMLYLVAEIRDPYDLSGTRGHILPFGSYLKAEIQGMQLESVAVVPRHLLTNERVAIYEGGKLRFRQVETIRIEGREAIVRGELREGDRLITSSLQYPIEGMDLQLLKPGVEDQTESLALKNPQVKGKSPESEEEAL